MVPDGKIARCRLTQSVRVVTPARTRIMRRVPAAGADTLDLPQIHAGASR